MEKKFLLSCESTIDLTYEFVKENNIEVIFYHYEIDGMLKEDNMSRNDFEHDDFYNRIKNGSLPTTSQINKFQYFDYFEKLVNTYDLILHITLGTGMTPSYHNALLAANEVMEKHKGKIIRVIDSTCSSGGYGLLVSYANDLLKEGKSIEDVINWCEGNKYNIHHQFFSTDLTFFKRSGRVSGLSATIGKILGICPLMRLTKDGKIVSYAKTRGRHKVILETIKTIEQRIQNGLSYNGKIYVCHSNCKEDALVVFNMLKERFKKAREIELYNIGNIIASHCGQGTVATFFLGDMRSI